MNIQIQPQAQNNYSHAFTPSFKANSRAVRDTVGNLLYLNNSCFFRDDLNWHKLADMLIEKYKDIPKVKIKCAACSEGAEPYSLAMILIEKLGKEKAQKFFPIEASDINEEILRNPKQGIMKLSQEDIRGIKKLKINPQKYMDIDNKFEYSQELRGIVCTGRIKPILQDAVTFKKASFEDVIPEARSHNSVVMARNFWIYPKESEREYLAKRLFSELGDNSVCVIGELDNLDLENPAYSTQKCLTSAGFKLSDVGYCFTKGISADKSYLSNPQYLKTVFVAQK